MLLQTFTRYPTYWEWLVCNISLGSKVHRRCAHGQHWRAGGSPTDFQESQPLSAMYRLLMSLMTVMTTTLVRCVTLERLPCGSWPSYQTYALPAHQHASFV